MSVPLFATLVSELQKLEQRGLRRGRRAADTACVARVELAGRAMLAFCSNDYLGLAAHPRLVEALREGATRYGVGSGGSHLISGHSGAHVFLEERLAGLLCPQL